MTIADKILRAKADYDAVYEAGKASGGGGEVTETILEPTEVTENHCWDRQFADLVERENCDFYSYEIQGMFGRVVKVKTILPVDSGVIFADDMENELAFPWYVENTSSNYECEKAFAISSNNFVISFSCVRTEGYPQVIVISGGGNASHTSCYDGTFEGEYIDNEITSVRYGAFAGCTEITKVSLPNCTNVGGNYAFYNMKNVKEILLPNVTSGVFGYTFQNCTNVETIDLRSLGGVKLDGNCFRYCSALETLILGGTEINTLANTNVLSGTPASMSIYVPHDLVDAYKGATNWTTYASRIKSRNDYPGGPI